MDDQKFNLELTNKEIKELIECMECVESEWSSLDYDLYLKLAKIINHKDRYRGGG